MPEQPWTQAETREITLLAHWPVAGAELERMLPPELTLETFDGQAWLGVVCYRIRNIRLRGLPPLPGLSALLALEVRTYVTDGTRPGVWLFSLDATNRVLVEAAKRRHRLPAYAARVRLDQAGASVEVEARREGRSFEAVFEARGRSRRVAPGSLEHFVCERYLLYTADGGRLYRADLHHSGWRVRSARLTLTGTSLVPVALEGAAHAIVADAQDLLVWPLVEV